MIQKIINQINSKDYIKAEKNARAIIKKQHNHYEAHNLLGISLQMQGKFDEAISVFKNAMKIDPKNSASLINISNTFAKKGDFQESLKHIDIALNILPKNIGALKIKSQILRSLNKTNEALEVLIKIVELDEFNIINIISLAEAYYRWIGDIESSKRLYEKAYGIDNKNTELLKRMCTLYHECDYGSEKENLEKTYKLGKELSEASDNIDEFIGTIQSAALNVIDWDLYDKFGNSWNAWTGAAQLGRVKTLEDKLTLIESHKKYGEALELNASLNPIDLKTRKRLDKKIRIGFLSSDLREHPVGWFAWPLIKHLDRNKFDVYCYYPHNYTGEELQVKLMERAEKFSFCKRHTPRSIASMINNDQIDILIDMAGYTTLNRIEVMSYKPAPIQISWLGYPHSTGIKTIDYIILDPYIKPPINDLLIEKPLVLPKTWVTIDEESFVSSALGKVIAEDKNGYITFGTLNSPYKLTREAISVWADIMSKVPNSRFIYMRPETVSPSLQENFYKKMESHGISRDRISFIHMRNHYRPYLNYIDIVLDTFPHTGGTITCETLWMGIPVITLIGDAMFERLSFSNLSNSNLSEFCAYTIEEYKTIALEIAKDKEKRRYLLKNLRAKIKENPLGQPEQFAIDFAKAIASIL
jgi:protein O-GlcNAc transferase